MLGKRRVRTNEISSPGLLHPALGPGITPRRVGDLTFDSDDLPRLDGFDAREASRHKWQQVFEAVRFRMENDDGEFSGS